MSDIPKKVTAISYEIPLKWNDKVIGIATVGVERHPVRNFQDQYVRGTIGEVELSLTITDREFESLVGSKMLDGISITPEEA